MHNGAVAQGQSIPNIGSDAGARPASASNFHFEPGWLARDVERASKSVERWERERLKNARPVQLVNGDGRCFQALKS